MNGTISLFEYTDEVKVKVKVEMNSRVNKTKIQPPLGPKKKGKKLDFNSLLCCPKK